MYLKRLVLRGFKSFAQRAELELEPGVTVVVGPNGSGKSNVVDAVAWVLGAQGARALRGTKMDDVIFAGTEQRAALGRAEVELTIDNSSGQLPIEFSEVTIARTLFRTGESEYRLNGAPCRLLDVQELLSDTGIGRSQHVIIGQGQLDAVLTSKAHERRAIIEEAAGVLKFRRRKEKAERRLASTEGNLLRLNDLVREVRRQLRPLERQADAARRHGGISAELRAIRIHLAGRELDGLQRARDAQIEEGSRLATEVARMQASLRSLDSEVEAAEHMIAGPAEDDDAEVVARAEALRERARGLAALVAERRRSIARELDAVADEGVVESLVADADRLRAELAAVDADFANLAPSQGELDAAEERVGTLSREVESAALLGADETPAGRERRSAERVVDEATQASRDADGEAHRWRARAEALAQALADAHEATGADAIADIDGVIGPLVDLVEIRPGYESAISAALGEALRAVVVRGGSATPDLLDAVKSGEHGALLMVVEPEGIATQQTIVPPGAIAASDLVHSEIPELDTALRQLLAGTVAVDGDWRRALEIAEPGLVVVTAEGDRLGGRGPWRAGPIGDATVTRRALAEATERAQEAESRAAMAAEHLRDAQGRLGQARHAEAEAARALRERRAELERLRTAATKLRRDYEVRGAGIEERRSVLAKNLSEVEQRLALRPDEEAEAHRRRSRLADRQSAVEAVGLRLSARMADIDALARRVLERRREQARVAREAGRQLDELRTRRAAAERELAECRERHGRLEVEAAETKLRINGLIEMIRRDFDVEPASAIDATAPEVDEGTTLTQRARELERELRLMGPVNPLALTEYESLCERHEFLQNQLDDVKASRRELQRVIRAVDSEIVTVFEDAFADVARHFSDLFATLFPGGSGRLVLSEPADILGTGIEIEARPSGKTTRRLSLLSGGERSLTALAYLFAVFRARPSPFYLMDEVEAALDDINLHRFIELLTEFRSEAQLIIVSHQKRTMEAADVLYGVSMPPGGSSQVVGQRMSDLTLEEV